MSLPDHDKDSVARMVQWLYTRKFELTVPISLETSNECYLQLAKLNTLADKYDICLLKNHIFDELFGLEKPPRYVEPPQIPVIVYVYNNTTEGSSFRKLMVAWYAHGIDLEWYAKDATKSVIAGVSQEFAIDLVIALAARISDPGQKSPFSRPSSAYHETPSENADEGHI